MSRRMPAVNEVTDTVRPPAPRDRGELAGIARDTQSRAMRKAKPTRQLFIPNSFDVTVPGEGTFRVPAATAEQAREAIVTWFREDQEPGQNRDIDPSRLVVVRTPVEQQEGSTAGGSLIGSQAAADDELSERVLARMLEIVRKKKGGGGYVLYAPNRGKKNKPRKLGEFPTRAAAKEAELARTPPKDSRQLQRARKRVERLRKDPKARARADRRDMSGRKRPRKTGAPARDRRKAHREDLTRALAADITERLFHDEELPGSPWDERIAGMDPEHVAGDRKLAGLHKGMERASISSLGAAQKALARALRGMAQVHPGDISRDSERGKTFMPMMLDVDGSEVGPLHLFIDGGHVRVELPDAARRQIDALEPELASQLRGGLMSCEEDHLPGISHARKAWAERDKHMDAVHARVERQVSGMSEVERHLARQLLGGQQGEED